ncbi:MAG TPA: CBS domain-containing protein [Candidatus Micrarchaeaceae archaeon]|nr:CBS domain-containing protein [Candidatus Micrarchaeaceae archaeon]
MSWTVSDVMSDDPAAVRRASELVAAAVVTTTAGTSLASAASLMFQHRVQFLPVVDSAKRPVGLISRARLLKVFLRSDELIRREVAKIVQEVAAGDARALDVTVTAGLVSLSGEVSTPTLLGSLIQRTASVPGVVGVKDEQIRVLSESRSAASGDRARA